MEHESQPVTEAAASSERRLVSAAFQQFERLTSAGGRARPGTVQSTSFPGYRVLREIHRGGQGVVFQAVQESTRRKVAIKVLRGGPFADATELARFDREVDVLSRLKHPHIVTIHDRGLTSGHAYYVMDYIPGRALDAFVAGGDRPLRDVLSLFVKVCDAVNVAHLRGVIHRDLKPGNIRVDDEGEPRILDFGLAKFSRESGAGSSAVMTLTGQFVGSLPWASPEQAGGDSDLIDVRTDVYSLGVVLYQLLTGRFPYPVVGRIRDVVQNITQSTPTRPSTVQRRVEHDLELIVLKCLAKEPERRYQSAGELAADIRLYLAHQPVSARAPSAGYRLRKFVRRNRALVTAGGVTALALVAAATVSLGFGLSESRQRRAADAARLRAEHAESAAQTRANELAEVTRFQQAQLAGLDAQTMGARLRANILKQARASAQREKLSDAETESRVAELEKLIASSDFTGLALDALRENFFEPARVVIDRQFDAQPLVQARLLHTLGTTLHEVGLLEPGVEALTEALAIRRRELGDDAIDTIEAIDSMDYLLQSQGKLSEAEPYGREALERSQRVLGAVHPLTLRAMKNMGALLLAQGKISEAEPLVRGALEGRRRVLGNDDSDTVASAGDMGHLLQAQGKLAEAEPYFRETLETYRRTRGPEDGETLSAVNNMGMLLKTRGKLAEAEPYLREALETRRRVWGDDHPRTLTCIGNLAQLLQSRGKRSESGPLYQEALERTQRVLGPNHPRTIRALHDTAIFLHQSGRLDDAEPIYREALKRYRATVGDDHSDSLIVMGNLGMVLTARGKWDEAEKIYLEALAKRRAKLGEDHPDTAITLTNLSSLLTREGRLKEAEDYARQALEKQRRVLGREHPDTLTTLQNIAGLLMMQGNLKESEKYFKEVLEADRRVLGPEHSSTLVTTNNLGMLCRTAGRLDEAEKYCADALRGMRHALGENHPNTLAALANLGGMYQARGKNKEAVALLAPAEAVMRKSFTGNNALRLSRYLTPMGRAYVRLGEFPKAEPILKEAWEIASSAKAATKRDRTEVLTGLVELYEAWEKADPGHGHAAQADEHRAQLNAASGTTQPAAAPRA